MNKRTSIIAALCCLLIGTVLAAVFFGITYLIIRFAADGNISQVATTITVSAELAVMALIMMPLSFITIKYIFRTDTRFWKLLSTDYPTALKHYGFMLIVMLVSCIVIVVAEYILALPAMLLATASYQANIGVLYGDPLGMPGYITYVSAVVFFMAGFLQAYIRMSALFTAYYMYGSIETQEEERKVIYVHKSPLLSEIITETNFQSNNHYADQLFRYLGSRVAVPATVKNSVDIIKQLWKARMIDLSSVFLCDGSGLAPQNAIPADVFVDLLTYMSQVSKYKDTFISTLPVAGETGTLSGFLKDTSLHGKVQAKSGTTSRIKSYAGYMNIPGKGNFVFCVIVNNGAAKARVVQREIEHFLVDLTSNLPDQTL